MRALLSAGLISIASAGASYAADKSWTANPSWSGFYVGAHLGKAWGETGNSWRNIPAGYPNWEPDGDISYSSLTGGLHAGYLWQLNSLVYGIEGDFSWMSLEGNDSQFATILNGLEINYVGTIRGRLGIAYANSLIYATGGIAFSSIDKSDLTNDLSASNDLVGWTVGGGYEYAFGSRLRARIEYQFVDFGSAVSSLSYDHRADDLQIHSVRAGLGYGF
jgi:outer membrane immunogenic protein